MKRSVLVLLDFSKAYDTVWRQKLMMTLLKKGVSEKLVRWIFKFLENHQAKVLLNGEESRSRKLHQGLPQGSVLSPLLFLFYINDLAERLPKPDQAQLSKEEFAALFADDVSALATANTKEEAQEKAQKIVDIVVWWSKKWKLQLNADKCEVSFFSNWTQEAGFKPKIYINGKCIKFNPTRCFWV